MPVAGPPRRASTRTTLGPQRSTSAAMSRERSERVAMPSRYRVDPSAASPRRPGAGSPIRAGVTVRCWTAFLQQIHRPIHLREDDIMQAVRGTLATRGILIVIGALIAIAASAVTAVAVRAGAGGTTQTSIGAGGVAGPRDTITVVGEGTQNATPDNAVISLGVSVKQS